MKRSAPILAGLLPGLALILTSTAALAIEAQPKGSTSDAAASTATLPGLVWTAKQIPSTSDGNELGGDIALFGDSAMIGSDNILSSVPGSGAVYVYGKSGSAWVEQQKLEPSQPVSSGFFGTAIAIHGATAVIGQTNFGGSGLSRLPEDQPNAADGPAAAYVFEYRAGSWMETARLESPQSDPANKNTDRFAMAVAVEGRTVAIGASRHTVDPNLPEQGAVYIYADDGTGWQQVQKLVAADGRGGDHFGSAIAVQGDTMLIGARDATRDRYLPTQGAVYVFERVAGVWTERQRILPPSAEPSLQFGNSLAIEGDTALAGAPRLGDPILFPNDMSGKIFVLTRRNGWWMVSQQLSPSAQPRTYDAFGFRVALSGDLAVSGAWQAFFTDGLVQQGVVHAYERVDGHWVRAAKLTLPDGFDYGNFGRGVALSGRSLLATGKAGTGVMVGLQAHRPATAKIEQESLHIAVDLQGTTQAGLRIDNPGDETLDLTLAGAVAARPFVLQTQAAPQPQPWPLAPTATTGSPLSFALDHGSYEGTVDFTNMLSLLWLGNEQAAVWLNRFAAPTGTGAFTLDSLSLLFPPQEAGTLVGKQINLVAYYDADADGDPANAVRLDGDHFVTIAAEGQFETFATDFRVPGDGDIYVGYESSYARGGSYPSLIPVATDISAPVFAHSWYATTAAPQLLDLSDLSVNAANGFLEDTSPGGNWMIRATGSDAANDCITPVAAPWLHVDAAPIAVPAGGSTTITIAIDAAGLVQGTHSAQLCVASNDPSRAMQRVPVMLTVLPEGTIFSDGFEVAP